MLKLFSIFIFSLILAFRPVIPLIDYVVNYDYIATELCENIAQPEILCNGKCYLAKQISKTVDDEPKPSGEKVSIKIIDVFNLNSTTEIQIESVAPITVSSTFYYLTQYKFLFSESLLKPPLV